MYGKFILMEHEGIVMAVNITKDNDSTGAVTGNLLDAVSGEAVTPSRWFSSFDLREANREIADYLATIVQLSGQPASAYPETYPLD